MPPSRTAGGPNNAPVAAMALAASVAAGAPVALDASASSDADGDPLTFSWQLDAGTRAGGQRLAHVFAEPGTYSVRLVVSDPDGAVGVIERSITVTAGPAAAGAATLTVIVTADNGTPLAGAHVVAAASSADTGADGRAVLPGAPTGIPLVVRISRPGYLPGSIRTTIAGTATEATLAATLPAETAAVVVDVGGAIDYAAPGGIRVIVPARALVRPDGSIALGTAALHLTPVASRTAQPFGNAAMDASGQSTATLALGSMDIRFEQSGEKLDLAPGRTAQIIWPLASAAMPDGRVLAGGDALGLYGLDMRTGLWREEGRALVLTGSAPSGLVMQATVTHFSYWDPRYDAWVLDGFSNFQPDCAIDELISPRLQLPLGAVCRYRLMLEDPRWTPDMLVAFRYFEYSPYYFDAVSGRWIEQWRVPAGFNGYVEAMVYDRSTYELLMTGQRDFASSVRPAARYVVALSGRPVRSDRVYLSIAGGYEFEGATYTNGTVTLSAAVQQPDAWERIDFYTDSTVHGSDSVAPFEHILPVTAFAEGASTIGATAVRAGGSVVATNRTLVVDKTAAVLTARHGSPASGPLLAGASGVPAASVLRFVFDEPMRSGSIGTAAFSITPAVAGSFSVAANARSVDFTPATALQYGTAYSISMAGATDLAGNTTSAVINFTTEAAVSARIWGAQNTIAASADSILTAGNTSGAAVSFVQLSGSTAFTAYLLAGTGVSSFAAQGTVTTAVTGSARVAMKGNQSVIAWRETTSNALRLNRLNVSAGYAAAGPETVATLTGGVAEFDVAVNSAGDVAVVFTDNSVNPPQLMMRRYLATTGWEAAVAISASRIPYGTPRVGINSAGSPVAVWLDRVDTSATLRDVVWARLDAGSWTAPAVLRAGYNLALSDMCLAVNGTGDALAMWGYTVSGEPYNRAEYTYLNGSTGAWAAAGGSTNRLRGFDCAIGDDRTAFIVYSQTNTSGSVTAIKGAVIGTSGVPDALDIASYSSDDIFVNNGILLPRVAANGAGQAIFGGGRTALGVANFYLRDGAGTITALPSATGTYTSQRKSLFLDASGNAVYTDNYRFNLYR